MNLSITSTQTFSAQIQYSSTGPSSNAATVDAPREQHHRRRVSSDDQVTLSPEAQRTHKVRHEDDDHDHNPMGALDKLVSQFVRTMLKTMVGQDFNLKEPGQGNTQPQAPAQLPAPATAPASTTPAVASNPTPGAQTAPVDANSPAPTTPATTTQQPDKPAVAGPYANAVAAYYQVQSFSFDFSSTVNTEDGQQLGVSVHFSFSQSFYAAIGTAANPAPQQPQAAENPPVANPTPDKPVNQPFQGLAAQLTQTSFQFEVDFNGPPAATPATAPTTPAATDQSAPVANNPNPAPIANGTAPTTAPVAPREDDNPLLAQLDKLFERLQVWLKDAQGERQLVAVGVNRTTALYVGNLVDSTAPSNPPVSQPAADTGTATDPKTQAVNVVA